VIFEIGIELALAILVRVQQSAVFVAQPGQDKIGGPDGGLDVIRSPKHRPRFGHTGQHQPVPGSECLVVATGLDPFFPRLE